MPNQAFPRFSNLSIPNTLCLCLTLNLIGALPVFAKKGDAIGIGGYVHTQFLSDFRTGVYPRYSFILRRVRLKAEYSQPRFGGELEIGADELQLEIKDAFGYYRASPAFIFFAGRRKVGFSLEELTPANRLLLIERGLTNKMFGDYRYPGRDIGLAIEGELFTERLPVVYALGVYNGNRGRLARDDNNAKQFAERLTVRVLHGLVLGLNATQRNDSATGRLINAFGGDFSFKFGQAQINGEVLGGNSLPGDFMLGGYVQAGYQINGFEPCFRLEHIVPDWKGAVGSQTELTIGCNWHLDRQFQVKANILTGLGEAKRPGIKGLFQAQVSF
ncbi:MAG: porin [candidate division WOR-3 bacterium]